jgi:PilZ domain
MSGLDQAQIAELNAQDSAPYEDRRAYPRVPVAMPAFLQANGERHAVHLLDLSAGGAKLNCSAPIQPGRRWSWTAERCAARRLSDGKPAVCWGFASTASSTLERLLL